MVHQAVTRQKQVAFVSLIITVSLVLPLFACLKTIWWFGEDHSPPAWVFFHEKPAQALASSLFSVVS